MQTRCYVSGNVAALCIVLAVLINESAAVGQQRRNKTLYILSFLPYPSDNPRLKPFADHGPVVVRGAYLALESINNGTDILWPDYELQLIEANDGCNVSFIGVINLISQLYYSVGDKKIVGIVGPECANAVKAVSQLTGKPDVSLINVHYGNSPTLSYPYAFGILRSTEIDVSAVIALFKNNNWTRTAIIYDFRVLVYDTYELFVTKLKGVAQVAYSSPVTTDSIPLEELRKSNARIIVSFLRTQILHQTLCLAYHQSMIYPKYQWILVQIYHYNNFSSVSFIYNGVKYQCDAKQIAAVLNGRLTSWNGQHTNPTFESNVKRFPNDCLGDFFCFATYDAVWAMALALNNSIEPLKAKGLSLADIQYGNDIAAQIIKQEMLKLKFQGLTGEIEFNQTTGFIAVKESSIFQFFEETQKDEEIASFTFANGTIKVNDTIARFVSTNFDEQRIYVSLPLAAIFILLNAAATIIIGIVHAINTLYSGTKSIKASSARLNHFAYAGCYFINTATVLYTILETRFGENTSPDARTAMCSVYPSILIIGMTLVLGTILVKTTRVYYIFAATTSYKKSKALNDTNMGATIVALTTLSLLFCVVWMAYDHPLRLVEKTLSQSGNNLVILVSEMCYCKYQVSWITAAAIFEIVLLVFSVIIAFLSTKVVIIKEFQNQSIIILAYLLSVSSGIGGTATLIAIISGLNLNLRYGMICFLLTAAVYLCIVFLFLPPIMPVLKKKTLRH